MHSSFLASYRFTRPLLALCLCAFNASLHAEVFEDPELRFTYAPPLVKCIQEPKAEAGVRTWEPEQSCNALHCTDDVNSQRDVLACVAYPPSQFPRKVAFGGGAFYILLLEEKVTDYECLAGDPSWSSWERVDETLDGHPAVRFQGRDMKPATGRLFTIATADGVT